MKIFVANNGTILADGSYVETDTAYEFPYVIIFKNTSPPISEVEITPPSDYSRFAYQYINDALVKIQTEWTKMI